MYDTYPYISTTLRWVEVIISGGGEKKTHPPKAQKAVFPNMTLTLKKCLYIIIIITYIDIDDESSLACN